MAEYTTEVRTICEVKAGLDKRGGRTSIPYVLEKSWDRIFDEPFPIFDENYRKSLCVKILRHYYTREIAAETVPLWQFWLNTRMYEIMPYFNKLYESELVKYDPLEDTKITRKGENFSNTQSENRNENVTLSNGKTTQTDTGTDVRTVKSENKRVPNLKTKQAHSDTPQGSLQNVENMSYLSDATITENSGNEAQNSDSTDTFVKDDKSISENTNKVTDNNSQNGNTDVNSNFTEETSGFSGNNSEKIQKWRETFLNIDMMVVDSLSDLFMNVY